MPDPLPSRCSDIVALLILVAAAIGCGLALAFLHGLFGKAPFG